MKTERPQVTLYTDGACSGNPGPGGYGVVLLYKDRRKELSQGYRLTTNNRMELLAAIAGLQALKGPCNVALYSDSQYVVKGLEEGWAKQWRARGWKRKTGEKAANADLWGTLLELCETHSVRLHWVKGHAGDPENERCDELSVAALHNDNLIEDVNFVRSQVK